MGPDVQWLATTGTSALWRDTAATYRLCGAGQVASVIATSSLHVCRFCWRVSLRDGGQAMQFRIGLWPPMLSHTLVFVLGMSLVCLTMDEEFVPIKIRERQVLFSINRQTLAPENPDPGLLIGSKALLSQLKLNRADCRLLPIPVRVIANDQYLVLSTNAKYLTRLQKHLIDLPDTTRLILETQLPSSSSPCEAPQTVIYD
jgi:hypothetical protein